MVLLAHVFTAGMRDGGGWEWKKNDDMDSEGDESFL